MHYSRWFTSATVLTVPVSAYYPYHRAEASSEDSGPNTVSASQPALPFTTIQPVTLGIKKRRTRWNKRDNNHKVSLAVEPDTPNSMAVSQDGEDHSYFSTIQIGSEGKKMWMLIDSGSANTWVFGSGCSSQACNEHETFGTRDSETLRTTSSTWEVEYGSGDIQGVVVSDKFSFAGFEIDLGFGLATEASEDFTSFPMDGIIGLGRDTSNKLKTLTLMEVMAKENLLESNMYGIYLSRDADGEDDGQITFGAPDKSKFKGDITYTDSVADDGLWKIPVDGCAVDGQSLGLKNKNAIIDTGTSYILMPRDDAVALHDALPGSSHRGRDFTIPCDTKQTIQFTFSGVTYSVPAMDYVGKPKEEGDQCLSKIVGHQAFERDDWLLGDAFLKNVYTVFDFDEHRIGFGVLPGAKDDDVTSTPISDTPRSSSTLQTTRRSSSGSRPAETATASDTSAEPNLQPKASPQTGKLDATDDVSTLSSETNGAVWSASSSLRAMSALGFATFFLTLVV